GTIRAVVYLRGGRIFFLRKLGSFSPASTCSGAETKALKTPTVFLIRTFSPRKSWKVSKSPRAIPRNRRRLHFGEGCIIGQCVRSLLPRLAWLDIQHLKAKIQSFSGQRVIEIQNHRLFFDLMDAKIKVFSTSPADLNGRPDF